MNNKFANIIRALGSIIVAPRTLQAIGLDDIFPIKTINCWFVKGKGNNLISVNVREIDRL